MPDKRKHRGPHPNDAKLFAPKWHPILREAVHDWSWLRTRGYAETAALKVVGDRYRLTARQRQAVRAAGCSEEQLVNRKKSEVSLPESKGRSIAIDGFNLIITTESALSGGYLFRGRDGCLRDLASVHGTYRRVEETTTSIRLIGELLERAEVGEVIWFLDRPVSNSGRLKTILRELAEADNWPWQIELVNNPDATMIAEPVVGSTLVSADALVLDGARQWVNLGAAVVEQIAEARVIDLAK